MEIPMKTPQLVCNLAALAAILFLMSVDTYLVTEAENQVILGCDTWTAVDKTGTLYCAERESSTVKVAKK
jgi:hypothetical protein